jgi:hypothetical protein
MVGVDMVQPPTSRNGRCGAYSCPRRLAVTESAARFNQEVDQDVRVVGIPPPPERLDFIRRRHDHLRTQERPDVANVGRQWLHKVKWPQACKVCRPVRIGGNCWHH